MRFLLSYLSFEGFERAPDHRVVQIPVPRIVFKIHVLSFAHTANVIALMCVVHRFMLGTKGTPAELAEPVPATPLATEVAFGKVGIGAHILESGS